MTGRRVRDGQADRPAVPRHARMSRWWLAAALALLLWVAQCAAQLAMPDRAPAAPVAVVVTSLSPVPTYGAADFAADAAERSAAYADAFSDGCPADDRLTFVGLVSETTAETMTFAPSDRHPGLSYAWAPQGQGFVC